MQPHPLHSTCLHFYSALANEASARLAHNLSTSKLQTLRCAKVSYQDALRSMPKPKPIPMDKSAMAMEPTNGVRPRALMAPAAIRPNSNRPDSDILGARYDDGMTDGEMTDDEYHNGDDPGDSSGDSTPTVESHSDSPRCPSSQSSIGSFHDPQEKEQDYKERSSRTDSTLSATSIQLQLLSRSSGSTMYFGYNIDDGATSEDEELTPPPLRVGRTPQMHVSSPSSSTTVTATTGTPSASGAIDPPPAQHGTGFRLSRPTSVYYPSNPFSLSRSSSVSRRSNIAPAPTAADLALLPVPAAPATFSPEVQAVMRFNAQLYGFKDILYSHIEDVNNAITATEEVQRARRENGIKGVMFEDSVDEEGQKRRRRERIEKLRKDGWRGERFWGKRYQRVAERAESELVGGGEGAVAAEAA